MSNMALWEAVYKTDPKHVKRITGKQYQGSSPKPYYLIEKATSVFGSCGIGWGINVISERFERFGDTESQHIALVEIWYIQDGKRGAVQQMGQTRSSYVTSSGKFTVDEDAAKKSVTDGMVKCLSMLGFAGDIFGGRWDDSKYQDELANDFADKMTDADFKALNDLLDAAGADKEAFCKAFGIKAVKDLPLGQLAKATGMLHAKLKAKENTNA
jgi:hypothetical protein